MNKKADMSVNTIVAAALAIFLLIILMFVFKNQIGNFAGGFFSAGSSAKGGISGMTCQTLIGGRVCEPTEAKYPKDKYNWELLPKPTCDKQKNSTCRDDWYDCSNKNCYEITSK